MSTVTQSITNNYTKLREKNVFNKSKRVVWKNKSRYNN